jgi:hypothetical protein
VGQQRFDRPGLEHLDLDRSFLRLDNRNDVATSDVVTGLLRLRMTGRHFGDAGPCGLTWVKVRPRQRSYIASMEAVMRRYKQVQRRSGKRKIIRGKVGSTARPALVPGQQLVVDEPALSGPGENPETDIAPTVLSHLIASRTESVETDVASAAIDDAAPAMTPTDPETCSEPDGQSATAEDLH